MTTGKLSILAHHTGTISIPIHGSPIDDSVLADLIQSIGPDATEAQIEIFDLFFNSTPALMDKVSNGAGLGDWDQVSADLHALKGSCELFGATRLTQQCKQLGKMLAEGETARAPARVQEIRVEYERVVEALRGKRPARTCLDGAGHGQANPLH